MASKPKKHNLGLCEEMLGFYITALGYALKGGRGEVRSLSYMLWPLAARPRGG